MSQPTDSDAAGKTDNVEIADLKRQLELLTRMLSEQSMDKPQQKTDIASGTSVFRVGFSPESDLDEQNRHAGPGEKRHPHPSRFSQDENENRPNRPPCRFWKGWDGLLQEWIDWSESKATRKNKRSFGNQFVAYLKQEGIGKPEDLSPKHLFAYKEQLMNNASLSTNSVHAMLCSGVKSFCTFLFQETWTRTNVGLRLKSACIHTDPGPGDDGGRHSQFVRGRERCTAHPVDIWLLFGHAGRSARQFAEKEHHEH